MLSGLVLSALLSSTHVFVPEMSVFATGSFTFGISKFHDCAGSVVFIIDDFAESVLFDGIVFPDRLSLLIVLSFSFTGISIISFLPFTLGVSITASKSKPFTDTCPLSAVTVYLLRAPPVICVFSPN